MLTLAEFDLDPIRESWKVAQRAADSRVRAHPAERAAVSTGAAFLEL